LGPAIFSWHFRIWQTASPGQARDGVGRERQAPAGAQGLAAGGGDHGRVVGAQLQGRTRHAQALGPGALGHELAQAAVGRHPPGQGQVPHAVLAGGGQVLSVTSLEPVFPGVWNLDLRLGSTAGNNVVSIEAAGLRKEVVIEVR